MENQEIEIKLYVNDLTALRRELAAQAAPLLQARVLEVNLRFDTPDNRLVQSFQVLRLRQDTAARLTFKGPAASSGGARVREEIEFVVEDFTKARLFLEALGYGVVFIYQKYRSMFELEGVHVTLDEMPYGDFVELEGPDVAALRRVCARLRLDWDAGIPVSYTALFEGLKASKNLTFRDLTFENFQGLQVTAEDLGVRPADELRR